MDVRDYIRFQAEDTEFQLRKAFENLEESRWDRKSTPSSMSPRETVANLQEAYEALPSFMNGQAYAWGSVKPGSGPLPEELDRVLALRAEALDKALSSDDPQHWKFVSEFITLHDAYHVGQIVLMRLDDETFTPSSIYRHA